MTTTEAASAADHVPGQAVFDQVSASAYCQPPVARSLSDTIQVATLHTSIRCDAMAIMVTSHPLIVRVSQRRAVGAEARDRTAEPSDFQSDALPTELPRRMA